MKPFEIIHAIEHEARSSYGRPGRGYAYRKIGEHTIECEIVSAMINRGMATGDTKRATWKVDGKRASRDYCVLIAREA